MRQSGVQPDAGHRNAERAGAQHAHACAPGNGTELIHLAGDDRRPAPGRGQRQQRRLNLWRLTRQDRQIGRRRQNIVPYRPGERTGRDIGANPLPGRRLGADDRYRLGPEQQLGREPPAPGRHGPVRFMSAKPYHFLPVLF
jgi:hypothetical protein